MRVPRGFTLVEMVTVLVVVAVTLSMATGVFNGYLKRSAAKRAAEVFVQDLKVTRGAALQSRQVVVLDFDEANLQYVVRSRSGDTLAHRSFDRDAGLVLSSMDLQFPGDTLAFDGRGVATVGSSEGALGRAVFRAGSTTFTVSFNAMGASRIDGP